MLLEKRNEQFCPAAHIQISWGWIFLGENCKIFLCQMHGHLGMYANCIRHILICTFLFSSPSFSPSLVIWNNLCNFLSVCLSFCLSVCLPWALTSWLINWSNFTLTSQTSADTSEWKENKKEKYSHMYVKWKVNIVLLAFSRVFMCLCPESDILEHLGRSEVR